MFPVDNETYRKAVANVGIIDVSTATIRQICSLAAELERLAEERMIHLEIGNPGLEAERVGVEAEVKVLEEGIANKYPAIQGIPELKEAGSEFIKAFIDIDVPAKCIVPTVGSMQGSFTLQLLLSQRLKEKDTMLFLNPGFPANMSQAKVLGIKTEDFDIYEYRGAKLEAKLESVLSKGNVTALMYSNPNNPAWTNLTEQELEIIGRLATKYDCIVLEDMAYFGMDFRTDISVPFQAPYASTVARYTDNYILLLSASKIFSYAGQRIALVCMGPKVYDRKYEFFEKFYEMPAFGDAYIYGVLYVASSGGPFRAVCPRGHAQGCHTRRAEIHQPLQRIWPSRKNSEGHFRTQQFPYRLRHGWRPADRRRILLHHRLSGIQRRRTSGGTS